MRERLWRHEMSKSWTLSNCCVTAYYMKVLCSILYAILHNSHYDACRVWLWILLKVMHKYDICGFLWSFVCTFKTNNTLLPKGFQYSILGLEKHGFCFTQFRHSVVWGHSFLETFRISLLFFFCLDSASEKVIIFYELPGKYATN